MTSPFTAIFESGLFYGPRRRSTWRRVSRVELIVISGEHGGEEARPDAAEILARIAAMPTSGGDPGTSENHDRILYGEQGVR